jgi:hypothetical protein
LRRANPARLAAFSEPVLDPNPGYVSSSNTTPGRGFETWHGTHPSTVWCRTDQRTAERGRRRRYPLTQYAEHVEERTEHVS